MWHIPPHSPSSGACWRSGELQIVGPAPANRVLGPPRYQPASVNVVLGRFRLPAEQLYCSLGVDFQMRGLEGCQTCLRQRGLGSAPDKLPPLTRSWPAFNVLPPAVRSLDTGSPSGKVGNSDSGSLLLEYHRGRRLSMTNCLSPAPPVTGHYPVPTHTATECSPVCAKARGESDAGNAAEARESGGRRQDVYTVVYTFQLHLNVRRETCTSMCTRFWCTDRR